jgi:hypothetical protein
MVGTVVASRARRVRDRLYLHHHKFAINSVFRRLSFPHKRHPMTVRSDEGFKLLTTVGFSDSAVTVRGLLSTPLIRIGIVSQAQSLRKSWSGIELLQVLVG